MSNQHDNYTYDQEWSDAVRFAARWADETIGKYDPAAWITSNDIALAYANEDTNVIHHERDTVEPWQTARHYGEEE